MKQRRVGYAHHLRDRKDTVAQPWWAEPTLRRYERQSMFNKLNKVGRYIGKTARLMVGIPDYEAYVAHMRNKHPDQYCLSYEEFFRDRQQARYAGKNGSGKCC